MDQKRLTHLRQLEAESIHKMCIRDRVEGVMSKHGVSDEHIVTRVTLSINDGRKRSASAIASGQMCIRDSGCRGKLPPPACRCRDRGRSAAR